MIGPEVAATAYRNLGAIAGLGDPTQALAAYKRAIELDPGDMESLLGAGWIELERKHLAEAESRLGRVVMLTESARQSSIRYWAQVGLADIQKEADGAG